MTNNAQDLIEHLRQINSILCTVESCTGGLLSAAITDNTGCSDVFFQGQVTYANASKRALLHIPAQLLHDFGAVSPEVAEAMALSAAQQGHDIMQQSCLGLSTTGVAGPGNSEHKPVGLVYIAASFISDTNTPPTILSQQFSYTGNRSEIRQKTVLACLKLGLSCINGR